MIAAPMVEKMDCGKIKRLQMENGTLTKLREQAMHYDENMLACPNSSEYNGKERHSPPIEFHKKLVVPQVKHTEVLCLAHEGLLTQVGVEKTTTRVTHDFY